MPALQFHVAPRQSQTLSPRQQHAVRLLQMSSVDFAALIRAQLANNPFLASDDDEEVRDDDAGHIEGDNAEPPIALAADDRDLWLSPGTARSDDDGMMSALDRTPSDTMLNSHLHSQLSLMALDERDHAIACAIVESLDDDGYLRTSLADISSWLPLSPPPTADELAWALKRVQSLEPTGVAARSVEECLLLQCREMQPRALRRLAHTLVERHLHAVAARDIHPLSTVLNCPANDIVRAIEAIRRLSPRPGWSFGSSRIEYVVPDVIVQRAGQGWSTRLNPAAIPRVRLHTAYAQLFQQHRSAQHGPLQAHLQDARWTLRNVRQRFSTILSVATAIVRKQHLFLELGPMAMKPLVLRDIAHEVGVHESTVSRVTHHKYISTPLGTFELKYFFSRPMVTASGNVCSATAIREVVSTTIATEDPAAPWSDGDLARQLAAQGVRVARRTVTKYRQQLKIEAADKRRRHL